MSQVAGIVAPMPVDRVDIQAAPVPRGLFRHAASWGGGARHAGPVLAREHGGPWSTGDGPTDAAGGATGHAGGVDGELGRRLEALRGAVETVVETDLDALDDEQVKQQLRGVQRAIDRLTAHRSRSAGLLERRAIDRAGDGRRSRATRDSQQFLREELGLTPSEAKQAGRTGRELANSPRTERAHRDGDLREPHARVIAEVLRHLTGAQRREVESRLLEAARTASPTELRRLGDRLLARADEQEAERAAARRHDRRFLRMSRGTDGRLHIHGAVAGIDAEIAQTAIDAFRVPDAERERRSPEQAAADAFVAAMRAALDSTTAPNQRGVPPHVIVVARGRRPTCDPREESSPAASTSPGDPVPDTPGPGAPGPGAPGPGSDVEGRTRPSSTPSSGGSSSDEPPVADSVVDIVSAEGLWSGPLPASEVRRLCRDAVISRVVVDERSAPLEAPRAHRSPGSGLWRALLVRDRGCRWPGCDAPPAWCDVAHGLVSDRDGGRLSPGNALLLCRRHHRKVDDGWRIDIDGAHVTFTSPGGRHRVESPPPTPLPGEDADLPPPTLSSEDEGGQMPPSPDAETDGESDGGSGPGPSRAPPGT